MWKINREHKSRQNILSYLFSHVHVLQLLQDRNGNEVPTSVFHLIFGNQSNLCESSNLYNFLLHQTYNHWYRNVFLLHLKTLNSLRPTDPSRWAADTRKQIQIVAIAANTRRQIHIDSIATDTRRQYTGYPLWPSTSLRPMDEGSSLTWPQLKSFNLLFWRKEKKAI